MTTKTAGATTVVALESHRARRSSQRESVEFQEAMRRHPSFNPGGPSGDAVVLRLGHQRR